MKDFILGISITLNMLVIALSIICYEKKKKKVLINRSENDFIDSWTDFWSKP